MEETKKEPTKKAAKLPFPLDIDQFIATAKAKEEVSHAVMNDGAISFDGDPEWPIFFGPPFAMAGGAPEYDEETRKLKRYMPFQNINGVPVMFLKVDTETDCGVYLRSEVYEAKQ